MLSIEELDNSIGVKYASRYRSSDEWEGDLFER